MKTPNLLPKKSKVINFIINSFIIAIVFFVLINLLVFSIEKVLVTKTDDITMDMETLSIEDDKYSDAKKLQDELIEYEQLLENNKLIPENNYSYDLLSLKYIDDVRGDITLNTLSYENELNSITGTTSSFKEFQKFTDTLKKFGNIKNIQITNLDLYSGVYTFTITYELNGGLK